VNLLIIGGLAVVAIVAILGAIFLGVSEERNTSARTAAASPVPAPVETPAAPAPRSAVTRPTQPLRPPTPRPGAAPGERAYTAGNENQQFRSMNGQLYELADELRELSQQAWELEHRLRSLSEMIDRAQQNHAVSIEEEVVSTQND
jgi:TolA-binding protein